MLHEETVETSTLALIRRLMADENLTDFYLVGGTALSLKLSHRISIDIDLFIGKDFDSAVVCVEYSVKLTTPIRFKPSDQKPL